MLRVLTLKAIHLLSESVQYKKPMSLNDKEYVLEVLKLLETYLETGTDVSDNFIKTGGHE